MRCKYWREENTVTQRVLIEVAHARISWDWIALCFWQRFAGGFVGGEVCFILAPSRWVGSKMSLECTYLSTTAQGSR